jgi:RimJ/RimL family protein N-acetyltransferase
MNIIINTKRLVIRKLNESDAGFLYKLWTNPKVMRYVGFPKGLNISIDQILNKYIINQQESELECLMVASKKDTCEIIGECHMSVPDDNGICETDVKLSPEYWGNKYGLEIKKGMVDYIFKHTDAIGIRATPNVDNIPSQKMQESIGAKKVCGANIYVFPEHMRDFTTPVKYYTYIIFRNDWKLKKNKEYAQDLYE